MNNQLQMASTYIIEVMACRKALLKLGKLDALDEGELHDVAFMEGFIKGVEAMNGETK
tara:strand:- start:194 stop:367 length:174 start_codon:yes stop_codon:yes gene_type:complete